MNKEIGGCNSLVSVPLIIRLNSKWVDSCRKHKYALTLPSTVPRTCLCSSSANFSGPTRSVMWEVKESAWWNTPEFWFSSMIYLFWLAATGLSITWSTILATCWPSLGTTGSLGSGAWGSEGRGVVGVGSIGMGMVERKMSHGALGLGAHWITGSATVLLGTTIRKGLLVLWTHLRLNASCLLAHYLALWP